MLTSVRWGRQLKVQILQRVDRPQRFLQVRPDALERGLLIHWGLLSGPHPHELRNDARAVKAGSRSPAVPASSYLSESETGRVEGQFPAGDSSA